MLESLRVLVSHPVQDWDWPQEQVRPVLETLQTQVSASVPESAAPRLRLALVREKLQPPELVTRSRQLARALVQMSQLLLPKARRLWLESLHRGLRANPSLAGKDVRSRCV